MDLQNNKIYFFQEQINYLFEKFGISEPKNIEDLFKIQKFYNEELIKIKKKEIPIYRELDSNDIRDCILDELQEFKKELPYEFNFKTYRFKEFSPDKLKEEFTDILNFMLCKAIKNEDINFFENAWKNYNSKGIYSELDTIDKNDLSVAIRIFEHWAVSAEFEVANTKSIAEYAVSSYLELGTIFGFSKEIIYEQYWKKFLYNCKRDLKME